MAGLTWAGVIGPGKSVATFGTASLTIRLNALRIRSGGRLVLYHGEKMPTMAANEFVYNAFLWGPRANDRVIRAAMRELKPIRDSHVDEFGNLIREAGKFIERERRLLERGGWTYKKRSRTWEPPKTDRSSSKLSSQDCIKLGITCGGGFGVWD